MKSGETTCIWQHTDWPEWHYDLAVLTQVLTDVSRAQGLLLGRLSDVGMALRDITSLLELGVLQKSPGGGRSTSYELTYR